MLLALGVTLLPTTVAQGCPSGSDDYVGNRLLSGTAPALRGAIACVDSAASAYRSTVDASIGGGGHTVDMFGPFEAGFTSSVPGMGCLGSSTIAGGIDTYTAQLMVQNLCGDPTIQLLDACGDHAQPRHFHEYLAQCLSSPDAASGHSSRIGTAFDDLGIYGHFESEKVRPALDVCGAHVGVTPDSNGLPVVHYHAQLHPPFFVGCYTNADASTTLEQCRSLFLGCAAPALTVTTAYGTGSYQPDCPCWDTVTHSNVAGEAVAPAFWPSSLDAHVVASAAPSCDAAASLLPFGGVCPASETVCPPCTAEAPVKCPSGGCKADIRQCTPNVVFRGDCDGGSCEGVEWCHLYPRRQHACWEAGSSHANASVVFQALDPTACGHCLPTRSHYACHRCCGERATAQWSGTYSAPDRAGVRGGGLFMSGSRWVCMLAEVAEAFDLENSVVASLVRPPPPPDTSVGALPPLPAQYDEYTFPMPESYNVRDSDIF